MKNLIQLLESSEFDREEILKQIEQLEKEIKTDDFQDPVKHRKLHKLRSLLYSSGKSDNLKFDIKKRQSNRVTSFTRDRR